MYQLSFDLSQFLADYWHKKPTIIKNGFANFIDPISAEELAGLSMEECVDSRYISNANNVWQATHGPLDENHFATLPDTHWQLIVQACNHWHMPSAALIEPFQQLPQWLFDDLMVCYSAPGGGVGPHIDQYDVFIIQGHGKRRWRVGDMDKGQYQEKIQAGALRQIESFDAIIDQELEPGDILYIPPGFPHEGTTLEPSLSYSIGFRSPKEQELLSNFADYILANDIGDVHLHNPQQAAQPSYGMLTAEDKQHLTTMLTQALQSDSKLDDFLGTMLSQSRHQLDIVEPDSPYSQAEVEHILSQGVELHKVSGLRAIYHQDSPCTIYINGESFTLDTCDQELAMQLSDRQLLSLQQLSQLPKITSIKTLQELLNKGYWFIQEECQEEE
ncbi:ribosomal protein uL16 3-hydroxylase [Vibrio sp. LaRot3]|uniref:ribosomal protein uL16 3-hydroxylase n=1 Tax=Vibrio sp. LaRot3 TaxID=2998829 RepID=UPI0022CDC37A|nr:cupin domain-containing protein [Vibrio sp. LaRot3]MDA0147266.1 cupin domain-containing protein [Vibrio sp. LaRot3]